jgi:hypothetical protein
MLRLATTIIICLAALLTIATASSRNNWHPCPSSYLDTSNLIPEFPPVISTVRPSKQFCIIYSVASIGYSDRTKGHMTGALTVSKTVENASLA